MTHGMTLHEVLEDVAAGLVYGVADTEALDEVMAQVTMAYKDVTNQHFHIIKHFIRVYHDVALAAAFDDEFDEIAEHFAVVEGGDCE